MTGPRTAFAKMRDLHRVAARPGGGALLWIDRILLHERTGAVALGNMIEDGRAVADPEMVFATIDHIVSTLPGARDRARAPGGEVFMERLRETTATLGLRLFDVDDPRQGIVHVIAPDLGIALPGTTLVCPDSHTCTLGGLGALAWGIGSTECEHVLATHTLGMAALGTMRVRFDGRPAPGVTAKDMILALIARHGAAGGRGHAVEFDGAAVRAMRVEERLTLCNMGVEFGAFTAFVSADDTVFEHLAGRPFAPAAADWEAACAHWRTLATDPEARFDREIEIDATRIAPMVTWGTSLDQAGALDAPIPAPDGATARRALDYMGLCPGQALAGRPIQGAFIGSCTNGRLADLRRAAAILKGRHVAKGVRAICVPGSTAVKRAAEAEGLDRIFQTAGFEWHDAGCGFCFYAGGATFAPGDRVISATNRSFEGRQGPGVRTHVASPDTVAWSAVTGAIADARRVPA